jgi:hypothetical protein
MSTKLARKIVVSESPIGMAEAFTLAMQERTNAILEGLFIEMAPGILLDNASDDYDTKLDNAIDYVMGQVNESGIDCLESAIVKSSNIFRVNKADIQAIFENAINDDTEIVENINYDKFQKTFLQTLDNILEQNSGNIVGFLDTTSAYVTPKEGKVLVEVFSNLNPENKQQMVEKLISSKRNFNSILKFAESTLNEA